MFKSDFSMDGSKLMAELAEANEKLLPIEEIDDPEVATLDYRPDLVHKSRPDLRDTLKRAWQTDPLLLVGG